LAVPKEPTYKIARLSRREEKTEELRDWIDSDTSI